MSLRDYDGGYPADPHNGETAEQGFRVEFPNGYGCAETIIRDWKPYGYPVVQVEPTRVVFNDRGPVAVNVTGIVEVLPGTCHPYANPNDRQARRQSPYS